MRLNSNDHRLTGTQVEGFRSALHDAFFNRESFEEFLFIQLNRDIGDLTAKDIYKRELFNIVKNADEEGWSAELLQGACLWRPSNAALALFAQQFGLISTPSARGVFESKILPHHPEIDVSHWCAKLMELVPKICRIDFPFKNASKLGTGFLLGKNLVMTNYHVMEDVFKGVVDPTYVSLRFDYRVLEDGRTLNSGIVYHLPKENWWRDVSEYSPLDEQVNSEQNLPDVNHLDYVLLCLDGNPGLEPVGGPENKNPQRQRRGWISLPSPPPVPMLDTELFILHHPDGKRLKITLNTASVSSVNSNYTRMRHQTDTTYGTSGAPCFNFNWELVALHQAGDPSADKNHPAETNQSIPFATIWQRLERRDVLRYLGDGQQDDQPGPVPQSSGSLPAEKQGTDPLIPQPEKPERTQGSACASPERSLLENKFKTDDEKNPSFTERLAGHEANNNASSPLEQARASIEKAKESLQKTMMIFTNGQFHILPRQYAEAICLLKEVRQSVHFLKALLENETSLLPIIREYAGDVYHQCNTIFTQIEEHLIPIFHKQTQGNFSQLKLALDTIDEYFSKQE